MKLSVVKSTSILMLAAASVSAPLRAADSELKDDAGKTIIRYVVEPPAGMAAAGTMDPAASRALSLLPGTRYTNGCGHLSCPAGTLPARHSR